ncbi:MAG TPA: hypothetical protein VFH38_10375 [Jatrophihabitans sp.]|nr:hypothetical protein [Jatrophihabitans sp.]
MRTRFKAFLAVGLAAVLSLGLIAPNSAGAQAAAKVKITGGTTTLTVPTATVNKLLGAQIVALVTAPGTQSLNGNGSLTARYPVSGGAITAKPPGGTFTHRGGLYTANLGTGQHAAVDNFTVDLAKKVLTARIVGTSSRLIVFNLVLKNAVIKATRHLITISRVGLRLEKNAAGILNGALGTTVFTPGMNFGTAVAKLRH